MTNSARLPFLPVVLIAALAAPIHGLSIKPSPPPQPPKSLSSRSGSRRGRGEQPSMTPLRAYTVAENNNKENWLSLLKIPKSWDFTMHIGAAEDSLFSFEGGSAIKAAVKPLMPNLKVEAAMDTSEKDDLISKLSALTKTFHDLESSMDYKSMLYEETITSYELKVKSLEEKNTLLEEGLNRLTVTLESQDQELRKLQQQKVELPLQAHENSKVSEENEMLRRRIRALEVELSDIAFESRKLVSAPSATAENTPVSAQMNGAKNVKLSPRVPSAPVPTHIYQQNQLEKLQLQVKEYERERSSVRKLFALGIRRGVNKVGRALNLWSPTYNLLLWGKIRN